MVPVEHGHVSHRADIEACLKVHSALLQDPYTVAIGLCVEFTHGHRTSLFDPLALALVVAAL